MYAIEIQIKPENDTWFSIVFQFQHIDRFVWVLFLFFFKQKILLEQRNYSTSKSKDTFGILSSKYKTIPPFLSFSKYWFLLKNIYCTVFIGEVYLILEKKKFHIGYILPMIWINSKACHIFFSETLQSIAEQLYENIFI